VRRLPLLVLLGAALNVGVSNADVDSRPNGSVIRAGHNIAVTTCITCHVVDSNQIIRPILDTGIPSFQDVANQRNTSVASITRSMKSCIGMATLACAHCWPTNRISDSELAQVAAYILSLRELAPVSETGV
jgi:mono/diheme cytochrome c family protein